MHYQRPDRIDEPLYVVTSVFNPCRYNARWQLYHRFVRHVEQQTDARLYTVEIAMGEREFAVTRPDEPRHLRLRTSEVLWHKERAINLLVRRLPENWKYLAWIDADLTFARPDWANETKHLLQHHPIIQMFRVAEDLDFDYNPIQRHLSFAASYLEGVKTPKESSGRYDGPVTLKQPAGDVQAWHPGFAWAIRRDAFDDVGGLLDIGLCGAGDNHMAKGLIGNGGHSCHPDISAGYRKAVEDWQERATVLRRNVGYMKTLVLHHWHGTKASRLYWDRWKILTQTQFDPSTDLRVDSQGLYRIHPDRAELKRRLREYFSQRDEDARK